MWDYGRLALIQKEDQGYVWYCNFSKGQLLYTDFSNNHFVNCDTYLDNSNINTVMLCPGTFSESKPCEIVVVLILGGLKCSMDQGKHLRRDVQVRKVV